MNKSINNSRLACIHLDRGIEFNDLPNLRSRRDLIARLSIDNKTMFYSAIGHKTKFY
jgi:hypothetical protein